jgi:hypothetical protein
MADNTQNNTGCRNIFSTDILDGHFLDGRFLDLLLHGTVFRPVIEWDTF